MKKNLHWILIGIAIILRLVLSASTYHQDLGAFALSGKFIAGEGRWLSFYDQIASKDVSGNLIVHRSDVVFNYQPLAYLLPSVVYLPFSSLVRQTGELLINRDWISTQSSSFVPLLTLYKLPMILADLAILCLLPRFFSKEKHKRTAQLLWAFNPLAIYVSSMMGQVDIIIAFLILVSFHFARNKKLLLASVFVALSALIKPIGLILIPIYAIQQFHQNKNLWSAVLVAFSGIGVYILGILPYIFSASYRYYALFAEQINKSTYASISIASGHDIPFFFILYALVVFAFWSKRIDLKTALVSVLLSSLVFTHFHPQWLVWLMPLFILLAVEVEDYLFYLAAICCWLGVLFSFDGSLHLQLFLHSQLALPTSLTVSNTFKEVVQMSRAGLIAILVWFISYRQVKPSET
jgi:Gpi18-like mannosyltransferase